MNFSCRSRLLLCFSSLFLTMHAIATFSDETEHVENKRRLSGAATPTDDEDCCYRLITDYALSVSILFQIFNGQHTVSFQGHSDRSLVEILPVVLRELVIANDTNTIKNFTIATEQTEWTEYKYSINVTYDSQSKSQRSQLYFLNELFSDYTVKYRNVSRLAIMLQSSISVTPSSREHWVHVLPSTANTSLPTSVRARDRISADDPNANAGNQSLLDVARANDINYDLLNEWYFMLILLVSIMALVICSGYLIRNYVKKIGICEHELNMEAIPNAIKPHGHLHAEVPSMSLPNYCIHSDAEGDDDEHSLLNSNESDSDLSDANHVFLINDVRYDSTGQ